MENYEVDRFQKGILKKEDIHYWNTTENYIIRIGFGLLAKSSYIIGSLLVVNGVSNGTMTTGSFVLFGSCLQEISQKINIISWKLQQVQNKVIGLEKACELLKQKPKIQDNADATELNISEGKIQFKNVNFGYKSDKSESDKSDKPDSILKNINLDIKCGQTVGIVGPTGNKELLG